MADDSSPVQIMDTGFDPKVLPVGAAGFIAQREIHDRLFSTDSWGSYLIYRLYPGFRVYFDDRHDFYGEAFVKECAKSFPGGPVNGEKPLDKYQVQWVLMPHGLSTVEFVAGRPRLGASTTMTGWRCSGRRKWTNYIRFFHIEL